MDWSSQRQHASPATASAACSPPIHDEAASFLNDENGTAARAIVGGAGWSSQPPHASSTTTAAASLALLQSNGGEYSFSSSLPVQNYDDGLAYSESMAMDTCFVPTAMADPSQYYYFSQSQTTQGFPRFLAPVAAFAPQPGIWQQQHTTPPPMQQSAAMQPSSSYSQAQETGALAVKAAGPLADPMLVQEAAPNNLKPAPRRRGRPRKLTTTVVKTKPASSARTSHETISAVTDSSAKMSGEAQVQQPDQAAAGVVAVAPSDDPGRTAPATSNPAASLHDQDHQCQLQSSCGGSPGAADQAATTPPDAEVMGPYADPSAPGVRFCPTDAELIFYLRRKYAGKKMPVDFFTEFNVYDAHPEDIRAACGKEVDGCWYAFSRRGRKYLNGGRPDRSVFAAGGGPQVGFWKSNDGAQRPTPWKMEEYTIEETQHNPDGSCMVLNDWVLCKLFYKEPSIHRPRKKTARRPSKLLGRRKINRAKKPARTSTEHQQEVKKAHAHQTATVNSDQVDISVEDYLVSDEPLVFAAR